MPVEGVPLTDSVSDERLDGDLMLCGIKHDKIVEGDRPLDAEGLALTVPLDAALVEPVERVRTAAGADRDAETRIRWPVTSQSRIVEESPAVDGTAPGERFEEVLDGNLVSQRDGGLAACSPTGSRRSRNRTSAGPMSLMIRRASFVSGPYSGSASTWSRTSTWAPAGSSRTPTTSDSLSAVSSLSRVASSQSMRPSRSPATATSANPPIRLPSTSECRHQRTRIRAEAAARRRTPWPLDWSASGQLRLPPRLESQSAAPRSSGASIQDRHGRPGACCSRAADHR